ncbi:MAG: LUD domain-containing protein [Acidimicrobiia bacterium]|nr:LUD domain-containing protein [Acidimicrobiia bacterium]
MERDVFLGRVQAALRGDALPAPAASAAVPQVRFGDAVARFVEEARAVDAEVSRVNSNTALEAISRIFEAAKEFRYLAWDGLDDVLPGLADRLQQASYQRVDATVATDPEQRRADHARIGVVPLGITAADTAIAASGSVVLAHGNGRPRSASLLVDTHIVLLPVGRIVHSLADALEVVDLESTSNVVVVTGPSRTSDIESALTLGVHGPRHVHILLIE